MSENSIEPNTKKLEELIYLDFASPGLKKIGLAIANFAELFHTLTLPVELLNKKAHALFEKNIEKYRKKLDSVPEEKIVEVPSEISFPILNRFRYLSNEELSNAFVNLLVSASVTETATFAHPGFIAIIDRISPDEAKLLKFLKTEHFIPTITMKAFTADGTKFFTYKKRTGLEKLVNVSFADNMDVYLDNLESLGLIQMRHFYINQEELYNSLKREYQADHQNFKSELNDAFEDPQWEMECYIITAFCRLFMKACIE